MRHFLNKIFIEENLLLIVFFLSFFNVFNLGKIILFMCLSVFVFKNYKIYNIRINKWVFILSFLMFSYTFSIFFIEHSIINLINILFKTITVMLTCIFANIIYKKYNKEFVLKLILVISFSSFLYSCCNILYEIINGSPNLLNPDYRMIYDIWKNVPITATQIVGNMILTILYPFIAYIVNVKRKYKVFLIAIFIVAFLISLYLGSRSYLFLALIVNVLSFFILFDKKQRLYFIILFFSCLLFFIILIMFDIFSIRTMLFRKTYLFQRILNIDYWLNEPRINAWMNCFRLMIKFPFGNLQFNIGMQYAHNLVFDFAYSSGLPAFILCIYVYYTYIKNLYYLLQKKDSINIILFAICLIIFLFVNLEPVINGYFLIFVIFIFLFNYIVLPQSESLDIF